MGSTSGTFPCPAPPAQAALGTQAGLGAAAFTTANSFILLTKHLQLNTMGKKKSSCCLEGDRLEKWPSQGTSLEHTLHADTVVEKLRLPLPGCSCAGQEGLCHC